MSREPNAPPPAPRDEKSTNGRAGNGPSRGALPPRVRLLRTGLGLVGPLWPDGAARVAERLFLSPRRRPRPEAERRILEGARHLLVPSEYGPIAAWQWGEAGPQVLLVHGWEGRGAQLGALGASLAAQGLRAIAFDAPGHGQTAGSISSLLHFSRAVHAASAAFGRFHAIVTHSMGGPAAVWALAEADLADRIAMISPPVDMRDFTRQLSGLLGLGAEVRSAVHRRLAARFGVPMEDLAADALAPRMRLPLLVVHDEEDREVPIRCGELWAARWPGASLVRTRGLGHHRILRDEPVLREIQGFVAASLPRRVEAA